MSSGIGAALDVLTSKIQALNVVEQVMTNEPKSYPGNGTICAIFFRGMKPYEQGSGLNQISAAYHFTARLYTPFLAEPVGNIDRNLIAAADAIYDAVAGAYTLAGDVRNVDFFGEAGQPMDVKAGYIDVSGTICRVIDIEIPLIVNDSVAAFVQ